VSHFRGAGRHSCGAETALPTPASFTGDLRPTSRGGSPRPGSRRCRAQRCVAPAFRPARFDLWVAIPESNPICHTRARRHRAVGSLPSGIRVPQTLPEVLPPRFWKCGELTRLAQSFLFGLVRRVETRDVRDGKSASPLRKGGDPGAIRTRDPQLRRTARAVGRTLACVSWPGEERQRAARSAKRHPDGTENAAKALVAVSGGSHRGTRWRQSVGPIRPGYRHPNTV